MRPAQESGGGNNGSGGSGSGGIRGEVILRPVMPVEMRGVSNQRPYAAALTILDMAGRVVAAVHSGDDGRFEAVLPPGTYRVRPESDEAHPRAPACTVQVVPGRYTPVCIVYDSGIR